MGLSHIVYSSPSHMLDYIRRVQNLEVGLGLQPVRSCALITRYWLHLALIARTLVSSSYAALSLDLGFFPYGSEMYGFCRLQTVCLNLTMEGGPGS